MSTTAEPDWDAIWRVERDICFLYHELADFAGIFGDLAYGSLCGAPYWQFLDLDVPHMREEEKVFVRDGCLIMLLAMAWDALDGSGSYLLPHLDACQKAVERLNLPDPNGQRLAETVSRALELVQAGAKADADLEDSSVWANRTFVQGYFRRMAEYSEAVHKAVL